MALNKILIPAVAFIFLSGCAVPFVAGAAMSAFHGAVVQADCDPDTHECPVKELLKGEGDE